MNENAIKILATVTFFFIVYIVFSTLVYILCKASQCKDGKTWNCYPNECKFWGFNQYYGRPTN